VPCRPIRRLTWRPRALTWSHRSAEVQHRVAVGGSSAQRTAFDSVVASCTPLASHARVNRPRPLTGSHSQTRRLDEGGPVELAESAGLVLDAGAS